MLRRQRFGEVISRQLDLFEREQAELVRECKEAEATYAEVGARLGLSKERVRQIERGALTKLREQM